MIPPSLQALISGWTNAAGSDPFRAEVCRQLAEALQRTLERHPVVPLDELRAALDCTTCPPREALEMLCCRYQPQQPNPHPQGTYLWAREEHARGRHVGRAGGEVRRGADWEGLRWSHEEFVATDWEVVQ